MNNNLVVIDQRVVLGKIFRIYGTFENPLFLARDVAEWIEYSVSNVHRMLSSVDDEEKTTHTISMNGNYKTEAWFLTEDGLYEVLMQSRKPIAKEFKKEVKKILKSVRQNGMYATDSLLDDPELFLKTVTKLTEERRARVQAEEEARVALEQKALAEAIIEEQAPKVAKFDQVVNSEGLTDMNALAKILAEEFNGKVLGRNKLMDKLRIIKVLTAGNLPYQQYMDRGYFAVKKEVVNGRNFDVTFITPKGIDWLIGKLNKELTAMQERQRIYGF